MLLIIVVGQYSASRGKKGSKGDARRFRQTEAFQGDPEKREGEGAGKPLCFMLDAYFRGGKEKATPPPPPPKRGKVHYIRPH